MSIYEHPTSSPQLLDIYLRAYVPSPYAKGATKRRKRQAGPSKFTLVFDIETTTDHAQRLKFGSFQFRDGSVLHTAGIFYDPDAVSDADLHLIQAFAVEANLECMTVTSFIEDIFYGMAFELRASIVGFNLPFDLSRLAIGHGLARGSMKGGYSLQLSADKWKPRVQVRHLTSRSSLIQFAGIKRSLDNRRMRGTGERTVRRGSFIDVKTIAGALTSRSFSLGSLADFLQLPTRKLETDQHGQVLSRDYLLYAMQDVQLTWEAFSELKARFNEHGLQSTHLSQILSEAGLGKAYLKEMGILPWRSVQPEFPDEITGAILSTYFGGRAEVHIRRIPTRVLYCDFLSMYPTVCTLMRLWGFVIANGMRQRETAAETRNWLASVTPNDLQNPDNWRLLTTIVRIKPDGDVLPVRARYEQISSTSSNQGKSTTIGLNHLSYNGEIWFTLADCIASKFLCGKALHITRAITFEPTEPQRDLKAVQIAGSSGPWIDPYEGDAYRELIDYRSATKKRMESANGSERDRLNAEQHALKILANSTSYGIFIEMNVAKLDKKRRFECHVGYERPFQVGAALVEKPGTYFHPLLGTLITGAARLMLALAERAVVDSGLDWAFCDTDSMAISKPPAMSEEEFLSRASAVCDWFSPLNPYKQKSALLKIEDINFAVNSRTIAPLYCLAISAKRYVLFNLDKQGMPIIRKASAHGLGHLLPPYDGSEAPITVPAPHVALGEIGVSRWQYDLWFQIIRAAYSSKPTVVPLNYHPKLMHPAVSRYAATTPNLLRWFEHFNETRPYVEQVKPFGFMCALQAQPPIFRPTQPHLPTSIGLIRPIAPYSRITADAAKRCFDRETGQPIDEKLLQSYSDALRSYHLSPELKFDGGDSFDQGFTRRRHIQVAGIHCIGKEANKWEEKSILGVDNELIVEYGFCPEIEVAVPKLLERSFTSDRAIAKMSGLSCATIRKIERREMVRQHTMAKAIAGLRKQETQSEEISRLCKLAKDEIARMGLTEFSRRIDYDPANLAKVISGKRNCGITIYTRLTKYFANKQLPPASSEI